MAMLASKNLLFLMYIIIKIILIFIVNGKIFFFHIPWEKTYGINIMKTATTKLVLKFQILLPQYLWLMIWNMAKIDRVRFLTKKKIWNRILYIFLLSLFLLKKKKEKKKFCFFVCDKDILGFDSLNQRFPNSHQKSKYPLFQIPAWYSFFFFYPLLLRCSKQLRSSVQLGILIRNIYGQSFKTFF